MSVGEASTRTSMKGLKATHSPKPGLNCFPIAGPLDIEFALPHPSRRSLPG